MLSRAMSSGSPIIETVDNAIDKIAKKSFGRFTYFNTLGIDKGYAVYAAVLPKEFNRQVIHLYLSNRLLDKEVQSLGVDEKSMNAINELKKAKKCYDYEYCYGYRIRFLY